jgi:hypothetical protein
LEVGEHYINLHSQHVKNECIYGITSLDFVCKQVLNVERAKKNKKYFKFVIIFHLLQQGP